MKNFTKIIFNIISITLVTLAGCYFISKAFTNGHDLGYSHGYSDGYSEGRLVKLSSDNVSSEVVKAYSEEFKNHLEKKYGKKGGGNNV
jgi:hypothetical protein